MKHSLIALCLITSSIAYGQDSVQALSNNKYFHLDIGIGYTNAQLGSINNALRNNGYEIFGEDMLTVSVANNFYLGRILIKNEFNWFFTQDVEQTGDLTTQFGGRSIGIGIGYAVIQKPSYRITPYIGLNAYTLKLSFIDNSPVPNIDNALNSTFRNSDIYFSNGALDVGIQMEKLIKLKNRNWDCPQNSRFMTLGVRVGYNFGFGGARGRYNGNQTIENAPTYSIEGLYVKAIIGFGSKIRNIKWKR
ncbi:MAG: hypothetical protein AAFX87_20780 [Bacteroidota bacterium]